MKKKRRRRKQIPPIDHFPFGMVDNARLFASLRALPPPEGGALESLEKKAAENNEDQSHTLTCNCHWCRILRTAIFAKNPDGSYKCSLDEVESVAKVWAYSTTPPGYSAPPGGEP